MARVAFTILLLNEEFAKEKTARFLGLRLKRVLPLLGSIQVAYC
jgi:hypothetical protein